MKRKCHSPRRLFLKGALATTPLLFVGPSLLTPPKAAAKQIGHGPSTATDPYLVPSIAGVTAVSILTVGDSVGAYRMVGIPDGLGAFRTGHKEFRLPAWRACNGARTAPGIRARSTTTIS